MQAGLHNGQREGQDSSRGCTDACHCALGATFRENMQAHWRSLPGRHLQAGLQVARISCQGLLQFWDAGMF